MRALTMMGAVLALTAPASAAIDRARAIAACTLDVQILCTAAEKLAGERGIVRQCLPRVRHLISPGCRAVIEPPRSRRRK